jgi:hypothetical protein
MIKRSGNYLLDHISISAALVLLLSALSLYKGFLYGFCLLIMGLITLEQGWVVGSLFLFLLLIPTYKLFQYQSYDLGLSDAMNAFLVWLGAGVLQHFRSWTFLLAIYTFVLISMVLAVHLYFSDIHEIWADYYKNILPLMKSQISVNSSVTDSELALYLNNFSYISTGAFAARKAVSAIFWLVLCSLWLGWARFSRLGVVLKPLESVKLTSTFIKAFWFIVLMAAFYWQGYSFMGNQVSFAVFLDTLPIVFFAPLVVGLVILHAGMDAVIKYYRKRSKASSLLLIMLAYTTGIILLFNWIMFVAPIIGIVDYYVNFRNRFKSSQHTT